MNVRLHLKHYGVNWCLLQFLYFPGFSKPFMLDTDASDGGIGGSFHSFKQMDLNGL